MENKKGMTTPRGGRDKEKEQKEGKPERKYQSS